MTEIRTLLKQSSHYFAGHILIMASGFISFPILTRIFSVNDYGILGLITTTLFVVIALSKLGLPNSIVRFYAEFKAKGHIHDFYSTTFWACLTVSTAVAMLFALGAQFIPDKYLDRNTANLLSVISIIVITACTSDVLLSFLRAEQRTKLYNGLQIVRRYASLGISLFFVLFVLRGLYGFFIGQIMAGMATLFLLYCVVRKNTNLNIKEFSRTISWQSISFGLPLIWAELSYLLLNYSDRYLIQLYLGPVALGLYTAGYNLSMHVTEGVISPINYSMTPIYMDILVKKGEEQTKVFFTKLFRYFLLIIIPIVFGFIAVGKDLIMFLASERYLESSIVMPYIVIGQAIMACSIILNSGLFIRKKTYILTVIMICACAMNVGLNIVLIPRYGILGAAQSALISQTLQTILVTYFAFREFSFRIDYPHISIYLIAAAVMYIIIISIKSGHPFENLIVKIPAGTIIYFILVLILDRDIRSTLGNMIWKSDRAS